MMGGCKTLEELSLLAVLKLLDQICLKLHKKFKTFFKPKTKSAIKEIQQHLATFLPVPVLEQLAKNEVQLRADRSYNPGFLCEEMHYRIKWAILLHSSLTTFDNKVHLDDPNKYITTDSAFLTDIFKRMSHLKELRLITIIVNDELLKVIGQACFGTLKVLEARSFLHVTDNGLECLGKCHHLEKMKSWSQSSYTQLSLAALSNLLLSCSNLQKFVGYNGMGRLLNYISREKGSNTLLKLTYLQEENPSNVNIKAIETLCPNLKHMRIDFTRSNHPLSATVFDDLANSQLALEAAELGQLMIYDRFENFLKKKGSRIKLLRITVSSDFNYQNIRCIGENCPRLQELSLHGIDIKNEPDPSNFGPLSPNSNIFTELRSVYLTAHNNWNPELALRMILSRATKVELICGNFPSRLSITHKLQDLFVELLKSKCLNELVQIIVPLPLDTIRKLILELPKLTTVLSLYSHSNSELTRLKEEIKAANLDFKSSFLGSSIAGDTEDRLCLLIKRNED